MALKGCVIWRPGYELSVYGKNGGGLFWGGESGSIRRLFDTKEQATTFFNEVETRGVEWVVDENADIDPDAWVVNKVEIRRICRPVVVNNWKRVPPVRPREMVSIGTDR